MLIPIITKRVFLGTDSGEPFVTPRLRRHKTPSMGHRREPEGCPEAVVDVVNGETHEDDVDVFIRVDVVVRVGVDRRVGVSAPGAAPRAATF